jgi:hypothetical protein
MLFLNIIATTFQLGITVIGCGVGQGWQSIGARAIGSGVPDTIEFQLHRQVKRTRNGRHQPGEVKIGRHGATS